MAFPSGAPMSTIEAAAFLPQVIQASMPAFCCSGVAFIICSNEARGALYRTRNFFMGVAFLGGAFWKAPRWVLTGRWREVQATKARYLVPALTSGGLRRVAHLLGAAHVDDAEPVENAHHLVGGVDLEPAGGEVRAHRVLVVVVLEQLTAGEDIDRQGVPGGVVEVEVAIAV